MSARARLPGLLAPVIPALAMLALLAGAAPSGAAGDHAGQSAGIAFDDRTADRLVITARGYRLTLEKRNGRILDLVDRTARARVAHGTKSCLWRVESRGRPALRNACSFRPTGARRFSYAWSPASATLALRYRDPVLGAATVTIRARDRLFDLRMTIANRGPVLHHVSLPGELLGDVRTVEAGYAPNVLPGVRIRPGFFERVGDNIRIYPSRWAFADFLALDAGGGHLSLSSVNSGPIYPVMLGFLRQPPGGRCSGPVFCIVHQFQTWIVRGGRWTSPVVRIRIGETAEKSILAYRHDNGIDAYPSLSEKLGARLSTLARAPLIKADLTKLKPFRDWQVDLARLPSPALLHPVAFQLGGHDENGPDFLPPDPRWGTSAEFASIVEAAHARDQLVMPYLNVSWWSNGSPTMRSLPSSLRPRDIAVLDEAGEPVTDSYGPNSGLIVSPFAPFVRRRVEDLIRQWRSEVPVDCLFFDQLGARPWLRDFNPASPSPAAYYDGWLAEMAPYSDRCLMAEDGWDRLARDFTGFHGSMLMMAREHDLPDAVFGEGNWSPYPLATWLFHDKVLLYQHDLYDGTMASDDQVVTWNMAFGLIGTYDWNDLLGSIGSPWLDVVGSLQRVLGPHYVGVPLTGYRDAARGVTESTYGDLLVLANWNASAGSTTGGYGIAPSGFLAHTRDDHLIAGAFQGPFDGQALSAGMHYLIMERDETSVTVRQPLGADTDIAVEPPSSWSVRQALEAAAIAPGGEVVGRVTGELQAGRFVFRYARALGGQTVAAYRITAGP